MEVINGIIYHTIGASSASLCYTPQKKVKGWSWQTYWLAQAAVCWLILPVLVVLFTIPQLMTVLKEAPSAAMYKSFALGMAYGIGGTAFGMAIRYVGFSITYAIAVGISCVLGTLLPPLLDGKLAAAFNGNGGGFLLTGVLMGAVGIGVSGVAGRSKEKDLEKLHASKGEFSLAKGLPLCILAGILSAFYGLSLNQGQPVAAVAEKYGAGQNSGLVIYLFSNTGAFITTFIYCLYLHRRDKTIAEYKRITGGRLGLNYLMAVLTGLLWYGQFYFYNLGHVRMGKYEFSSWAIHMILLVLLSALTGLLLKEWKNSSKRTKGFLAAAILLLITAVLLLTKGNQLGETG